MESATRWARCFASASATCVASRARPPADAGASFPDGAVVVLRAVGASLRLAHRRVAIHSRNSVGRARGTFRVRRLLQLRAQPRVRLDQRQRARVPPELHHHRRARRAPARRKRSARAQGRRHRDSPYSRCGCCSARRLRRTRAAGTRAGPRWCACSSPPRPSASAISSTSSACWRIRRRPRCSSRNPPWCSRSPRRSCRLAVRRAVSARRKAALRYAPIAAVLLACAFSLLLEGLVRGEASVVVTAS